MRDLDRWKDKVEISLDGRQIFFLFFGSAVAACLIFVVGVLIGKRIEARALAMTPAPIEDPLAALDQLGDADEADEGLTFHKALAPSLPAKSARASEPRASEPRETISDELKADKSLELVKAETAKPELVKPEPKSEANKEPVKLEANKAEPSKTELASKDKKPVARVEDKKAAPLPPSRAQVVAAAPGKKPDGNKPAMAAGHFTLQLSAFPEKSDAEEFMHKIQAAGYKPFLIASEIPGKGIFYRVRVGDFASRQAAVDAKSEFERKQRIIAYVAKL